MPMSVMYMDVTIVFPVTRCRDELPLQLVLPPAILEAKTPQELMSLALLGQGKSTLLYG